MSEAWVIAIVANGGARRCELCSAPSADAVMVCIYLGRGYLFDVCDACSVRSRNLLKLELQEPAEVARRGRERRQANIRPGADGTK